MDRERHRETERRRDRHIARKKERKKEITGEIDERGYGRPNNTDCCMFEHGLKHETFYESVG